MRKVLALAFSLLAAPALAAEPFRLGIMNDQSGPQRRDARLRRTVRKAR
jgi:hypothetical protein